MGCPTGVRRLNRGCPQAEQGLFVNCLWAVYELSSDFLRTVRRSSSSRFPRTAHDSPWAVHGLSMVFPWASCGLSVGCLGAVYNCVSLVAVGDGAFDSLFADQTRTPGRQQRAQTPGTSPSVRITLRTRTRTYVPGMHYSYSLPKRYDRKMQNI